MDEQPSTQDATHMRASSRKNTLFVTRLPYSVTNADLSTFFSDAGPLRRAFVVTDKASHQSKGVGYVTFADPADAERALESLQGASIGDTRRHIQLQWADPKSSSSEPRQAREAQDGDGESKRGADKAARTSLPERDPDAVRTIVLSGLSRCSPAADEKTIYKRVRKIGDVEHVELVGDSTNGVKDVAHVRFRTPNHAMAAVPKLHAHTFKGSQLSVHLKKRLDAAARRVQHMRPDTLSKRKAMMEKVLDTSGRAEELDMSAPLSHDSRLIVRNLPFDVTTDDLLSVFLPYGAVYDIKLPKKEESRDEGSQDTADAAEASTSANRGFAFVWFVSRADAERAMQGVNGQSLRHGAAQQAAVKSAKGKKGRTAAKEALAKVQEGAQPARPVAVDWSLAQSDWLSRSAAEENEEEEQEEAEDGAEEPDETDDEPSGTKRKLSEDDEEESEDSDEAAEEDEDADEDAGAKEPKAQQSTPDEENTLFIRNLPYQATETELRDLFRTFGPIRYARITMDPETKRSRGTGFVSFWKRDSADTALRNAEAVQQETSAVMGAPSKGNPFTIPSVITPDPSAPMVSQFTLHGRVLNIVRAVNREKATQLEASARKTREKSDKRNTWLLRESVPFPATPMAARLSEGEREKRMRSFSMRRAQLGANPSLHVSKTRLSVHQLPLFVTDKLLKHLALHALKSFGHEVKNGEREDLTAEEKEDTTLSSAVRPDSAASRKKRVPPSAVVQAKVVLQNDRIDPLTGKGRSRGYGFLEMRTFPQALKVLRWANANPELASLLTSWWREELAAQQAKLRKQQEAHLAEHATSAADEAGLRIKRIARALQDLEEQGTKAAKSELRGLLRIEFSIENVTKVRKRALRQSASQDAKRRKTEHTTAPDAAEESVEERPRTKKLGEARAQRRIATEEKARSSLGSLIGRKRKERKRMHSKGA